MPTVRKEWDVWGHDYRTGDAACEVKMMMIMMKKITVTELDACTHPCSERFKIILGTFTITQKSESTQEKT